MRDLGNVFLKIVVCRAKTQNIPIKFSQETVVVHHVERISFVGENVVEMLADSSNQSNVGVVGMPFSH